MAGVKTEMVSFKADGTDCPGYVARPDDDASHPGIVLIQEWWGLEDHVKDVAGRLAAEGYVVVAPDLYRGTVVTDVDGARSAVQSMDREQATKDLLGAITYLKAASTGRIGVVGFCMGGAFTLSIATKTKDIAAVVPYYGRNPDPITDLGNISAPVLAFYGETDQGVPPSMAAELEAELKKVGGSAETHVYPGAGHAFFNDSHPQGYNAAAATDAWGRTLAFFSKHLQGA